MKRLILSAAVLATFASCSKDEVTDVAPSQQATEIGFTTLNDRATKAPNDTNSDSYKLYATSTGSDYDAKFYINGEEVSYSDAIVSGNSYYWPLNTSETLKFYAYAPDDAAGTLTATATSNGGATLELTDYVVPSTAQQDLTVAMNESPTAGSEVALEFKHMLSKVTIKVELGDGLSGAGYALPETPDYTANLTVPFDKNTLNVVAQSWGTASADSGAPTYSGKTSYMIMPQDNDGTDDCYITIKGLDIVDATTKNAVAALTDLNLAKLFIPAGVDGVSEFEANTHYTFTIIVEGTSDVDTDGDGEGDENLLAEIKLKSTSAWGSTVNKDIDATDATDTFVN